MIQLTRMQNARLIVPKCGLCNLERNIVYAKTPNNSTRCRQVVHSTHEKKRSFVSRIICHLVKGRSLLLRRALTIGHRRRHFIVILLLGVTRNTLAKLKAARECHVPKQILDVPHLVVLLP
jgi:hypothetical protein